MTIKITSPVGVRLFENVKGDMLANVVTALAQVQQTYGPTAIKVEVFDDCLEDSATETGFHIEVRS